MVVGHNDGVLFWIGVQHPLSEAPAAGVQSRPTATGDGQQCDSARPCSVVVTKLLIWQFPVAAEASLHAQLRSCQQSLHSLQLQELYGAYTTMAQRTALLIQARAT